MLNSMFDELKEVGYIKKTTTNVKSLIMENTLKK